MAAWHVAITSLSSPRQGASLPAAAEISFIAVPIAALILTAVGLFLDHRGKRLVVRERIRPTAPPSDALPTTDRYYLLEYWFRCVGRELRATDFSVAPRLICLDRTKVAWGIIVSPPKGPAVQVVKTPDDRQAEITVPSLNKGDRFLVLLLVSAPASADTELEVGLDGGKVRRRKAWWWHR